MDLGARRGKAFSAEVNRGRVEIARERPSWDRRYPFLEELQTPLEAEARLPKEK